MYKRAWWVSSSAEAKERKLSLCQNMCGCGWRKAKNCTHSIIYKTIFGIKSVSTSSFNFVWMSREHCNLLTSMLHCIIFQDILSTFYFSLYLQFLLIPFTNMQIFNRVQAHQTQQQFTWTYEH